VQRDVQDEAGSQAGYQGREQHSEGDEAKQLLLVSEIDARTEGKADAVDGDGGFAGITGGEQENGPDGIVKQEMAGDVAEIASREQLRPAALAVEQEHGGQRGVGPPDRRHMACAAPAGQAYPGEQGGKCDNSCEFEPKLQRESQGAPVGKKILPPTLICLPL
jgi:hypothetical protein